MQVLIHHVAFAAVFAISSHQVVFGHLLSLVVTVMVMEM
jgi:hypothetical protein